MSNAHLQLDMDFVPLWKQKYAEQIEFTFMWINIQNSSAALVITIWPLDPREFWTKRGVFEYLNWRGWNCECLDMKNINTKSISSISLSYILGKETHKSLSHCPLLNFELCRLFGTNECLNCDRVCPSMFLFADHEVFQDVLMTRDGADADTPDHLSSFCCLWPDRAPGLHWHH